MININIIIIEDSKDYNDIINDFFTMYTEQNRYGYKFNIVGRAFNGDEGIKLIEKEKPDVVILDLILPNIDGIKILQTVNSFSIEKKPIFIVLSAINNERYQSLALAENIGAYFIKPTDFSIIAERIVQLLFNTLAVKKPVEDKQVNEGKSSYEAIIKSVIQNIGILPNLKGYAYLYQSVLLSINHPEYLDGYLTKILYPEIGKVFNTTGERVERSIRHAISKAWEGDMYPYFYTLSDRARKTYGQKPTAGFFILTVVEHLTGTIKDD